MISYSKALSGYGFARAKDMAFAAIRDLWRVRQTEGMSQSELADKMGRDVGWVSRNLSGPANWTLRTFGDFSEALEGEIEISVADLKNGQKLSNYDAYEEYGAGILQGAPPVNQSAQSGKANFLEAA